MRVGLTCDTHLSTGMLDGPFVGNLLVLEEGQAHTLLSATSVLVILIWASH